MLRALLLVLAMSLLGPVAEARGLRPWSGGTGTVKRGPSSRHSSPSLARRPAWSPWRLARTALATIAAGAMVTVAGCSHLVSSPARPLPPVTAAGSTSVNHHDATRPVTEGWKVEGSQIIWDLVLPDGRKIALVGSVE